LTRSSRLFPSLALAAVISVAGAIPAFAATVGLWHMDESSGKMVDSSGSGNSGTLQNVTRVSPGYNGGGRAYSFNGSSSRVIIDNATNLNPGSKTITITAHVKFDSRPSARIGDYDLVRKGSGVYKMEIYGTGQGYCYFQGTNNRLTIKAGPDLSDGRWHTIVCKKTSTGITLTVDGSSFSKNGNVGSISNGGPLILGGKPNASGDWYDGVMDEVSISTA
jgi:concanavalin A-like lectin/glucanase superfamily protein